VLVLKLNAQKKFAATVITPLAIGLSNGHVLIIPIITIIIVFISGSP
jgi:hypothetical protein